MCLHGFIVRSDGTQDHGLEATFYMFFFGIEPFHFLAAFDVVGAT